MNEHQSKSIFMTISTEQLLNLSGIRVLSVSYDEGKMECEIESTQGYAVCHRCGGKARQFHEHEKELVLRHLPLCGRAVILRLRPKRYRCPHCEGGVTTTERPDWYDAKSGCTKVFAEFLLLELVNSTVPDVGRKHRVTYDVVRGVLQRSVRSEVDWNTIKTLRLLGLDEISLLKGHGDFVTIVSAQDQQGKPLILAVLKGREKKTVVEFLHTIPVHLKKTIQEVCSDLYEGFLSAVAEVLPDARLVADRFHVTKLYRAAVDALRQVEMKELKSLLKKDEFACLKGVLWALRKNSANLSPEEKETLDVLFACSPQLRQAYRLREQLTRLFDNEKQTKESGRQALRRWMTAVKNSGLTCFDKFLATLDARMDIITNYFTNRTTSGWVEGLNNKIKVLKRRCYGLKNLPNLFRRIWLDLHGYETFAS
jgi:transposase